MIRLELSPEPGGVIARERAGRNSESVFRRFRLTIGAIRCGYCALRADQRRIAPR